jgi:Xaa-Pro aminopeptidase
MSNENLLMYADSERDADMLYAVGMFVPDPFLYLKIQGAAYVVMSDLEIDRARREASQCEVLSLKELVQSIPGRRGRPVGIAQVILAVAKKFRIRKFVTPHQFPLGLATELLKLGLNIKAKKGAFFPERVVKSAEEVKHLKAALKLAESGMAAGIEALRVAKVGKNKRLMRQGVPLTSERLRAVIDTAVVEAGGLPNNTIVAGGVQACDPHERGSGPLRAGELIILDIFPRSQKTGYYGDITRTVVKGRASDPIHHVYETVKEGQKKAIALMLDGQHGTSVHKAVVDTFNDAGYETGVIDGRMQGFFHGTGHGLGLEIHEQPRTGPTSTSVMRPGYVVTVEPGLYYPKIGGCRLEDTVLVTESRPKNLTRFPKFLEV